MAGLSKPPTPKVKTFKCPQCAQPLAMRGMLQTASLACSGCGTVIDISDDNMRIISAFAAKTNVAPAIPLGTRGNLPDGQFEVIGFMRRVIEVEGVEYRWREYLLFNPYKGFRWLSEYNGHWSYIRTSLHRPRVLPDGNVSHKGTVFRHFQSAQAKVDYVAGEFYWRVQAGESCLVQDFVAPPRILSMEQTDNEITWSAGEYIEPGEITRAFKLQKPLPARIGVGANQPSPHANHTRRIAKLAASFIIIALLIQLVAVMRSSNELVYQDSFDYTTAEAEKSRVTEIFALPGRPSNVVVRANAPVNNSWIYLSMALINDETGAAYDFGREISYYSGSDSDGTWTEGKQSDAATLLAVPPGRYYLRVEPDGPTPTKYDLQVYRDVPTWWPFFMTLAVLVIGPVIAFWRRTTFEYKRWSDSDHPMGFSSSEDDDE